MPALPVVTFAAPTGGLWHYVDFTDVDSATACWPSKSVIVRKRGGARIAVVYDDDGRALALAPRVFEAVFKRPPRAGPFRTCGNGACCNPAHLIEEQLSWRAKRLRREEAQEQLARVEHALRGAASLPYSNLRRLVDTGKELRKKASSR